MPQMLRWVEKVARRQRQAAMVVRRGVQRLTAVRTQMGVGLFAQKLTLAARVAQMLMQVEKVVRRQRQVWVLARRLK